VIASEHARGLNIYVVILTPCAGSLWTPQMVREQWGILDDAG